MTTKTSLKKAPDFTLEDRTGKPYSLSSFRNKNIVLFFYPKDDTPGCTIESKEFSSALTKFKKLNTEVIGISGGDNKTKEKFCKKHGLKGLMLSDPDFAIAKKYDTFGEKQFMGRKFMGIFRKTFVIDPKGFLVKEFDLVKPEGHAEEVLSFLKEMTTKTKRNSAEKKTKKTLAKVSGKATK